MKYCILAIIITFLACEKKDSDYVPTEYNTVQDTFLNNWTIRIAATPNTSYAKAEFRLWVPESTENLNAILVLTPGFNCTGITLADDVSWQQFAQQENIALVGVTYEDNPNVSGYYYNSPEETGGALIKAIDKICENNNLNNIVQLPLVLCGHSAGGCCSYNFTTYKPERVAGYINVKGGCTANINQIDIPGLLVSGEFDYPEILYDKAMRIRRDNGLVCYALEPGAYHEWGNPDDIMRPFISAVLKRRLDANSQTNILIVPLTAESGYLGNLETYDTYPYNEYNEDILTASWLISEEFAEAWVEFVSH